MKKLLAFTVVLCLISEVGFSQQEAQTRKAGPRRQLATIVFAGLGGAILGLSTLSFYGRPQDQLVNIAIGFAVGVIAGTTYVTIKSATSKEYYEDKPATTSLMEQKKFTVSPFVTSTKAEQPDGVGARLVLNF